MVETDSLKLPDLSESYQLEAGQAETYRQSGHIFLRGVASPSEVATYRPLIKEAAYRYNTETRPLAERDTYGRAFLQIMNLWQRDEGVRRFVTARRFAQIAARLMGVSGVRIYHDQALFKEGGGGPTPWHQDQHYWPLDTTNTLTMWMPLTDIEVAMGPMTFASGSHRLGYLGKLPISDESQIRFEQFIAERELSLKYGTTMAAGDATFHAGWMLHSAPPNGTDVTREAMTIIYFADGTRVKQPENANQQNDLAKWLPGLNVGEVAASPLNPLVYSETN